MKNKEIFYRCEYCDTLIPESAKEEQFEKGQIYINDGYVLLPKRIVEKNHKEGVTNCHTKYIEGYYCDKYCLLNHITNIIGDP